MPIRNAQPMKLEAVGVSNAIDGTNAFPGAMALLQDLVPNPSTAKTYTPRPASTQLTAFAGFTVPGVIEALLVVGTRAYGMIASSRFAGKSEPFCYDLVAAAFVSISHVTSANCPTTQLTSGDWSPPTMSVIGGRVMITHPGYDGANTFIGWIDIRGASIPTSTGTTHTSTLLDALPANVLQLGWEIGDSLAGPDIAAGAFIKSIAADGLSLVMSQAATGGHAGGTYTASSGTFAAPQYGAGQTNGQPLAAVPTSVINFNGRAYYAVLNGVQFSDSLNPLQITNATQQLTLGDTTNVTALGGLPLSNQVVGGVIQAVIAFKGPDAVFQITGDPATTNLANNAINGAVGTNAPNTVVGTPQGLAYVAPDGLRIIGLDGKSTDPIGAYGDGMTVPFINAITPSRMCAAYNQGVLRISVQNGAAQGQPVQEYWFDFSKKAWTGPHSFPASLIQAYQAISVTNAFVLAAAGVIAKLWQSTTIPLGNSTFTENGVAMSWVWQTCLLPDNQQVAANQVVMSAQGYSLPAGLMVSVLAQDEQGHSLGFVSISGTAMAGGKWDAFNWGAGVWGNSVAPFQQYQLAWPNPLVFKQMSLRVTGASALGFVIGNAYAEFQPLGYLGAA